MRKKVAILHFFNHYVATDPEIISLHGQAVQLEHIDCHENLSEVEAALKRLDGQVDAISLCQMPNALRMGKRSADLRATSHLYTITKQTPVFDGSRLQSAIERWGIRMAHEIEPGIWSNKRVLMFPSLNHFGLLESLDHYASKVQSADPILFGGMSEIEAASLKKWLDDLSGRSLHELYDFDALPRERVDALHKLIEWADIVAGDISTICYFATKNLRNKVIVSPAVSLNSIAQLENAGASILVSVLPNLSHDIKKLARHTSSTLEACLAAVAENQENHSSLTENDFLNLISDVDWQPTIRYLQPELSKANRFGFITQPSSVADIRKSLAVARFLPKAFIDRTAVHIPPVFHGRIEKITAEGKNHSAIGELLMLGGTPEEFTAQDIEIVSRRMLQAARLAEQLEARIIGADTASREVSDAISAIAPKTSVAATSGQALTVFGSVQQGVKIAKNNSATAQRGLNAAVINPGDNIAAIAAEVLAGSVPQLTLIGGEPDLMLQLKRRIEDIHLKCQVTVAMQDSTIINQSDIIVVGRTMAGKRTKFNVEGCRPGAVICDFSQPTVITDESMAGRPDLTVIESVAYKLPTNPNGISQPHLPPGVVSAPLAEAALLAINGRFSDFGLVGHLSSKHVYEMGDLVHEHGYKAAGIMLNGRFIPKSQLLDRAKIAKNVADRALPSHEETQFDLMLQPDRPSIRRFAREHSTLVIAGFGAIATIAGILGWLFRRRRYSSADKIES